MEKEIEQYLVRLVKARGGFAFKFISTNYAGVPDRIVLLPHGKLFFVELKSKGKYPSKLQKAMFQKIEVLGFAVHVIDSKEKVKELIERGICTT
ncbi:MAG: VRR-NUC domain-containing protein [Bacillota bacterium]